MKTHYDTVILGAGPAGLVAAAQLSKHTDNFVLIEGGQALAKRNRHRAADMAEGVGGAGLFSDGKFSGGTAASGLRHLEGRAALAAACAYVDRHLRAHGVRLPRLMSFATPVGASDTWVHKPYPSEYMPLAEREQLTARILAEVRGHVWLNTEVQTCVPLGHGGVVITARRPTPHGCEAVAIHARSLILAGGRFGPLDYKCVPRAFRRLEAGVRIIDNADAPLWRAMQGVDPKYRYARGNTMEWRTFCCCRRGEVVATQARGRITLSGRADCAPTQQSNIGFNWRVLDPHLAATMGALLQPRAVPVQVPLYPVLHHATSPERAQLQSVLGPATAYIIEGLHLLARKFPELQSSSTAQVAGPTLEGVGAYPDTDATLRLRSGLPIWVAGDSTGRFRGIVAAMLSGHYVAEKIASHLQSHRPALRASGVA